MGNQRLRLTEAQVQEQILSYLNSIGIYAWRNNSVGVYDPVRKVFRRPKSKYAINGVSDVLGILPDGRWLAIEVKKPCKNPRSDERLWNMASAEQKLFLENISKNKGLAFVADRLEIVIDKIKEAL